MTLAAESIASQSEELASARRAMIDSQLRVSGINQEWLLAVLARVPREDHVPAAARGHAYIDRAIPLGNGRSLAAPLVHGWMLSEAAPAEGDTALLVCGSGYLEALLRPLVGTLDKAEAKDAPKKGLYSLIVIDGAIEELPTAIADALADNGRIVTGLVERGVTRLAVGRKAAGEIAYLPLAEIGIPVLSDFAAPRRWSF